ncbi:MAG: S9 family peptidase [Planctomycetota bacterium]|nr:S9 family peptidase [Planctomycetota bacterium]
MADNGGVGRCVHAEIPGKRNFTTGDLWQIPRVGAPVCAPGGKQLVVPVTTWPGAARSKLTRLWLVNADGSGSRALTGERTCAGVPAWSPNGPRLAYTTTPRDVQTARPQLQLLSFDGGEPEPLYDFPLGVSDVRWLPDGSGLVVVSKLIVGHLTVDETRAELARREADPVKVHATEKRLFRYWDQWLTGDEVPHFFQFDLATGECRDLTPNSTAWLDFMSPIGQFDIAPDGRELAFAGLVMNEELREVESRIFRVSLDGGGLDCLTPDAPADCVRPRYSPDGKVVVYGRKEDRYFYADRARLHRYERASGTHEAWCDAWDQSPASWEFAPHGELVFVAEKAARTHLYSLAPDERVPNQIATGGSIGSPHVADDGCVYYTWQSFQQPPEVFCNSTAAAHSRITRFTEEAMSGIAMGEVREIECTGSAGETVQSFVILPPGHRAETPAPFINVVHGGPHGVWGDEFHFRWNAQLFASPGYVVAFPNFQGSTSWGHDFAQRIQGEWSKRPFEDVMAITDHLIDSGLVDGNRMAAAGGSYGGYIMSWMAGHTDRFRCLVNHAGVYNTLSMYASDATQGRERCFGGEPWSGLEAIDDCNPARFAENMATPMLVIHGEQDYRVPVTQGLECYGVLQAKGVPSRLVHFPDENHWVLKPHNSIRWYQEVFDWIDRWLGT